MTIDWEDFGQLYTKYHHNTITPPTRTIDRQTNIILDLLDDYKIKATFFILGITAEYKPELVKLISDRGHEIASHGYSHDNLGSLDKSTIKVDIEKSVNNLQDLIGEKIQGYRAPFFSLTANRLFVLEILSGLGLTYDSSIMPSSLVRNGIPDFEPQICKYQLKDDSTITEIPIAPISFIGRDLVISGGGYLRLCPKLIVNHIYNQNIKDGLKRGMLYMHPYEFDNQSIDVGENYPISSKNSLNRTLLNLKWNVNRKSIIPKLKTLFLKFDFRTCFEMVNEDSATTSIVKLDY